MQVALATMIVMLLHVPAGLAVGRIVPAMRPLPFFYDLYTFRGPGGTTQVVGAFAVEAGELETDRAGDDVRYRFSVSMALVDTAQLSVSTTHDSVFVAVPGLIPEDHLLYTHVQARAEPSATTRHRVIMMDGTRPGIGQLYTDVFPIPDYSGTQLMLSDIALGQPGARNGWRRGAATLALLPTSRFPSSAFDVYYEIYNLAGGQEYRTEIAIARAEACDDAALDPEPVRLRFTDISAAGADHTHADLRRVEASLDRGSYCITVTVRDARTGRSASRSRPFEVRGSGGGATMVPATPLPRR